MQDEGIQVLLVETAGQTFAVEVGQIAALRRKETLFPAREGPPYLEGFLPLGEAAIPVLDLGRWLGLGRETHRRGLLLVTAGTASPLALRVDRVEGPVRIVWRQVALLPEWLHRRQSRPLTWGLIWQQERLLPLLDTDQVVPEEEATRLHSLAPTA